MVKLHPINGFAAKTGSAAVIVTASVFGIPVSTTHNVPTSIMDVGAARRLNGDPPDRGRAHGAGVESDPAGYRVAGLLSAVAGRTLTVIKARLHRSR
jgi:phosphate/sulfate permease